MAGIGLEASNQLFDTLSDWEIILKAQNIDFDALSQDEEKPEIDEEVSP